MVGTILKTDLQSTIEDQLREYASGLGNVGQQAQQTVGDTFEDLQRAGRTRVEDVQAQLSDYATQAFNASLEAQRQAQEQAAQRAEQAAQVQQHLSDYATQVSQPQQQQPEAQAPAGAPALPQHEPSPPLQTDGTQLANAPSAGGQVFPLSVKPDNAPNATYHSQGGSDLMAPRGTPVLNMQSGRVDEVFTDNGSHTVGGNAVLVHGDDGLDYYYAHFDQPSGVKVGQRVAAGEQIGAVGNSGNAYKGGSGATHLHIGIGHGISNGVGSEGGLGQNFNAQGLLTELQSGIGQKVDTARGTVQGAAQNVAGAIDNSSPAAFARSFAPYAAYAADKLGIDPTWVTAMAASESNYGKAPGNELFGVKGAGNAGTQQLATHEGEYGGVQTTGGFAAYRSPKDAVDAWVDLLSNRYKSAVGAADLPTFIHGLKQGGYFTAAEPEYLGIVSGIANRIGGEVQGALSQGRQAVGDVVAGARRAPGDVIQAGEQAVTAAKAPIYGTAADAGASAMQQLTVIQDQLDALRGQLAGAPETARRTVTQAAEPIVAGVQQVGGAFNELNRNLRTAIGGTEEPGQINLEPSRGGGAVLGVRPPAFEPGSVAGQVESGQRDVRGLSPLEGLQYTGQVLGAGLQALPPTYQALAGAKRQAIEENNPIRDVLFAGGASSMLADAVTDPVTWALPWGRVANGATALLGRVPQLAGLPAHIGGDALMNGLQNAAMEMAQPNPTPERIAQAFGIGAVGGAVLRGAQSMPQLRAVGEYLLDQRGRGFPALQEFLRDESGELRVGGEPPERRVAGRQRLPNYDPNTPEGRFEAIARPLRESSPDGLLHLDLNTLPENVLPLDRGVPASSASGLIKTNPGGAPHTDDLRALYEANTQKRDFYADQSDQGVPTVGPDNLEEWFALNAITSQQTGVTGQVSEAVKVLGMVRKIARDGRAEGLSAPEIKANILKAVNDYTWSGPSAQNKRIGANKGYATGVSETGGIKTPTFAGNYGSAESRLYDPGITNDIHNWRVMNVDSTQVPAIREGKQYLDTPHESAAANNKTLYRGTEAVFNELAAEQGVDGYAFQSAVWDGIRNMQDGAPAAWKKWQAGDFKGAIRDAQAAGVFNRAKGVTGAPEPGEISRAMNQPSVKAALAEWGPYLKDPIPPELGISSVSRVYPGEMSKGKAGGPKRGAEPLRPASLAFRQGERAIAESYAPVVSGLPSDALERLGVDERGVMPWLAASHRVVEQAPGEYVVHLPAGNADTARYVAATIGDALGASEMPIHYPDHLAPDIAGFKLVADEATIQRAQQALVADGHATIRGPTGRSLQVPLHDSESTVRIVTALQRGGIDPATLSDYTGANERISADAYPRYLAETRARFEPTTAERRGLLERARGTAAEGFGRQPGQASIPFATNLAGGAFGGYAGNLATPADASPEERARNIAAGAATGFAAGHLIGRVPLRGAPEAAGRGAEPFRAPERPGGLELRATTQEPPGGPPGREPRTLGEVRSNPYALREAAPGETPMTSDEMLSYADELDQRISDAQARRDAIDEMLQNPSAKVDRPPWSAGYTNDQLATIARQHDISAYEPNWWEKVGLETGSGEVRENVGQGSVQRGAGQRELSRAELNAERKRLDAELGNIATAYEQMSSAPAEANLVRVASTREARGPADLPFDTGAPPEPGAAPVAEAGGGLDEGARRAQEIVLSKGRGTLRSDGGTVSLEGDVRATALVSHEAVQAVTETPPSARTEANMPNLASMLEGEPEIAAQIRKAAEDNPDLIEAYRQGTISMDSLRNDLAKRVGMTVQDWNKTPIGKGFNERELMALQAAAIEQQGRMQDLGRDIIAKGGVDELTAEELVFSAATLADTVKILAVARGGRTTAGRTLNALKQRFDRTMASGITLANEQLAARRLGQQARRAATRATTVLAKGREIEREKTAALATLKRGYENIGPERRGPVGPGEAVTLPGTPEAAPRPPARGILDQISRAYDELDRYNAMTLHEKGAEFDRLKAERAQRAAARKAAIRGAPEELLSALRQELRAEQDNFAKRKDTWESMAFWDTKAFENAMSKRTDFRGQLYIEQQRKVANIAAKDAEKTAAREFNAKLEEGQRQRAKAERLLQEIGGRDVTKQVLQGFVDAMNDPGPDAAAKFLKSMAKPSNWARATVVRLAGLLSGPLTHMANMSGNVARAVVEVPVRATTVGIDAMRAAVTGGERQAYRAELLPMLQAWAPGMYAQLPDAVRALKTGIRPDEVADLSKVRAGFGSGNQVVDAAVEMPLRLLTAEDVLFRGAAYSAHAQRVTIREAIKEGFRGESAKGRAASILQNLEEYPDLAKEINDAAAHMVFQEKRNLPLPRMQPGTRQAAAQEAGRFGVSQVIPFMQTPANITAQGMGMSPLGFGGALEAARGVREMPTGTRAERYARGRQVLLAEERAARAVVGTGILGAGIALGSAGMLTAAYSEDPAINSTYPQGWRPWSLRIGDPITKNTYYIPLQNFAVAGAPLAMAAIITDPTHKGKTVLDPEAFGMAVAGIGKYVLDNTFLQGMSDFVDALQDPNRRGGQFFESLTSSYGPYSAMGREIQRSMGTATRNPREGVRGLIDALDANYPGLSGTVPPALTPLGDERTQGATGLGRLAPFRYDIERDEPTLQVLRKAGVAIPRAPKAVGLKGGSIELTEDERAQLQQMRGAAIRDTVPRVRETSAEVQKAVELATASATSQFLNQLGADEVNRRWQAKQPPEPYYLGTAAS